MDLPVHVAAGALLGNAILYIDLKSRRRPASQRHRIELGIACFLVGVLSHIILDAMPHYDWLFYVRIFSPLPYWWLIPQVLATIPVLLMTGYFTRDHLKIALVSIAGGVYPDFEKLFYFDFHIPKSLVVFRWHSCSLSRWTPWEFEHKIFLIVLEFILVIVCLAGMYWFAGKRMGHQGFREFWDETFSAIINRTPIGQRVTGIKGNIAGLNMRRFSDQ